MNTKDKILESVAYLKSKGFVNPEVGIILGTGLGQLIQEVEVLEKVPYEFIPHFPVSVVDFHKGQLIMAKINDRMVVIMQGRFHMYEGYKPEIITYPVRVMHALGIQSLIVSNAAGAINLSYKKGELMLFNDHINLLGGSPLAFNGVEHLGNRFVDMSAPYDAELSDQIRKSAEALNITLHTGVYAAVLGPQLETRAEYRMLKVLGADAVGMSTVPEVIVANQLKIPVIAISILTDVCDPDHLEPIDIPDIMAQAAKAEPHLISLIKSLI
jgi:purine-nucleoside phosphorylase